jgi:hypothetical protein
MIPNTPYISNSKAERRVFDRLRGAFLGEMDGTYTAFHSLNLTRHAYKRFGEIDFLICCPLGIYVIEVKGGGISCENGVWKTQGSRGENSFRESPFVQAESALHGLMDRLRADFSDRIINQFSTGFGVVFPDCEWRVSGTEWDPHTLADGRGYKDLEGWLRKLIRYWRMKDRYGNRRADNDALRAVCGFLRPEFEAIVPLHVHAHGAEERIVRLTEDQMEMVDVVSAKPRVICSGGAGTGKTFLALELARRWTAEGMNVLLACRSPWLKNYLAARFAMPKLTISLVGSTRTACRRAGLEHFDALIVDEGQDMFDMDCLDNLDVVINGGLAEGRWCFFHDINNQAGLFGPPDQDAFDYLKSFNPFPAPLFTNCRNTRVILKKVQESLGADMGIRGAGDGPKIREHQAASREESGALLEREITRLVEHGGLVPGNVTILSPVRFEESCVQTLPEEMRKGITALDEFSVRNLPCKQINFAKIWDFKGLENEAIIVVDLPQPGAQGSDIASHYVAMSRARSVLSLVYGAEQ